MPTDNASLTIAPGVLVSGKRSMIITIGDQCATVLVEKMTNAQNNARVGNTTEVSSVAADAAASQLTPTAALAAAPTA